RRTCSDEPKIPTLPASARGADCQSARTISEARPGRFPIGRTMPSCPTPIIMLLALDAGNTNITAGIFRDGVLADHRRLRTVREQTSDELGILMTSLLRYASLDPADVDGIVVSSVVPPLNTAIAEMADRYF